MKNCKNCKWTQYVNSDWFSGLFCKNLKLLEMIPYLKDNKKLFPHLEFKTRPEFGCNLWEIKK